MSGLEPPTSVAGSNRTNHNPCSVCFSVTKKETTLDQSESVSSTYVATEKK